MKTILVLLMSFYFQSAFCQSADLKLLAEYMEGSYSSEVQHEKDSANYFDIRLKIARIWKNNPDGYWFYVEQAVAEYSDKPYRQRIYHLTESGKNVFSSVVFTMTQPLRFTHKPELVDSVLTPDSLIEREGCTVILRKVKENEFAGSTDGKKCPSDRSGAAYATSEVTIFANELHSWDRGYNDKDEQVWGATKGGYIFIKKK